MHFAALAVISIHALREEGDSCPHSCLQRLGISIHALREEGDLELVDAVESSSEFLSTPSARRATITTVAALVAWWKFLSTPSARRATERRRHRCRHGNISIHALREEGDRATGA